MILYIVEPSHLTVVIGCVLFFFTVYFHVTLIGIVSCQNCQEDEVKIYKSLDCIS